MRCAVFAVLMMLMALPALAQAPAGSADARPMALEPLPVNTEASRRLAGRVPLEAGTFTLPQVAALLEREVGVTVRFDWDGLAEVGITPETTVDFAEGEAVAERMLSMVLIEAAPDAGEVYPTYLVLDGTVVIGTNRSLVRLAPQVFWPQREEAERELTADERARRQLERNVTAIFDDQTLGTIIDYIRDATGANVVVNWPALELVGIDQDSPVTISISRVPAGQLLRSVLELVSAENFDDDKLGYMVVDGVVVVSTLADIRTANVSVEIYDIRYIQDWLTRRELRAVYQGDALAMELLVLEMQTHQDGLPSWHEIIDQVIELIQDTVGSPDEWLDEDSTIRELNSHLIIKTNPDNHRAVRALLEEFAESMHRAQVDFVRELEVVRLLRRSEGLREAGDYAGALALVEEALAVDPLHEPARALRLVLEQTVERLEFRE